MNINIVPTAFITKGIDAYLAKSAVKFHGIYLLLIFLVIAAVAALPFIFVDVSVQDSGIIRPVAEKTEIRASVTEFVDSIYVREGQMLNVGDTILTFMRENPDYRIEYQQKRLDDFTEHINDLEYLAKGSIPNIFSSKTRKQEYLSYSQQIQEYETNLAKAKKDFERNKSLYEKNVISGEEYENYQHEYNKALNAVATLRNNQLRQWQIDLNNYANLKQEMISAIKQGQKDKDMYVVICPVNGTLDQFSGFYKGSVIQAGSMLAIISPDSTLYAEVYVSPRNIGYISAEMPVNIQISAFNYNEWGLLTGKVMDISSDFITDDSGSNAFYKVKCSINKNFLVRKNGTVGKLKKGMTVSAHFMITRRSLFDLLYQKIDDWVNPKQNNNQ
jgi:multidrug resistance efflux pump